MARLSGSHFQLLAALISIGCGALLAFLIRTGWFSEDDFSNLSTAKRMGLSVSYLFKPLFGTRLSPGHRFLDWVVVQWQGHEWAAVVFISAVCMAGMTYLAAILVRQVTDRPLVALIASGLFGTWIGWMVIGLWWPTSSHTFPAVLLMLATLCLALRWDAKRTKSLLLAVLLTTAAAMLFSSRAAITPGIMAVLLVLGGPGAKSVSVREFVQRVRATWPPIALSLLAAATFVYFESRTSGARRGGIPDGFPVSGLPAKPDVEAWLTMIRIWMIDAQAAFSLNRVPSLEQSAFRTTIPGVIVAGALAACTIRGSRSALIWAAGLVLILVCAAQVGWLRLRVVGISIAVQPRYHEGDIAVLLALIPAAWAASGWPSPRGKLQLWAAGLVGAAVVVLWTLALAVGAHQVRSEPSLLNKGDIPKATIQTLRATFPNAIRGSSSPTLINTEIPLGLRPTLDAELPEILSVFVPGYRISKWEFVGDPIYIDERGAASRIQSGRSVPIPRALNRCLTSEPGSDWLDPGSATADLALPQSASGAIRVLSLELTRTRSQGVISIAFLPSSNENYPEVLVPLTTRRRGLRAAVPAWATSAKLAIWGGASTCLTNGRVLYAVPRPSASG